MKQASHYAATILLLIAVFASTRTMRGQGNCNATRSTTPAVGANFSLSKIQAVMEKPPSNLVLVIAHRGYWQYCPENTIEAMYSAFALGAEGAEMDVRASAGTNGAPGQMVLSHDYDTRGEFPGTIAQGNYYIPTRSFQSLSGVSMVDRFGNPAKDSAGLPITSQSLTQLFDAYESYLNAVPGGIVSGAAQRGAMLVIDIKGGDSSSSADLGQYASLVESYNELYNWETTNRVDLSAGVIFKVNYSAMPSSSAFAASVGTNKTFPTYNGNGPNLIFIVYPSDVMNGNVPWSPNNTIFALNVWRARSNYASYITTDYQFRYLGSSLAGFVNNENTNGNGVAVFQSNNSFPEGYRLSGGTCSPQNSALSCSNQPLSSFSNTTLEFLFSPPGFNSPYRGSTLTTDWFSQAVGYLSALGLRDTADNIQ